MDTFKKQANTPVLKMRSGARSLSDYSREEDEYLVERCLDVERADEIFMFQTGGIPRRKSRELLVGLIVQRWLRRPTTNGVPMPGVTSLQLPNGQTGYDAELLGHAYIGDRPVEFKSSAGKAPMSGGTPKDCQFLFHPDFRFNSHGLIVMTEFVRGAPFRMFLAHGSRVMEVLKETLKKDGQRESYRSKERSHLPLWSENRFWGDTVTDGKFPHKKGELRVKGLTSIQKEFPNMLPDDDWLVLLEQSDIEMLCPKIAQYRGRSEAEPED